MASVQQSGLIEWEGKRGRLVIGGPGALGALTGVVAIGALTAYAFTGLGLGLGGRSPRGRASTTTASVIGPPNAPTGSSVTVVDTSTWHAIFPTFVGSGGDTQDSIAVTVIRSGAADTLFDAKSATQVRDTISDNTDLKADTTYRVLFRQKGATGGWSNADTVTVVNTQPSAQSVFFACQWPTTGITAAGVQNCGDNDWSSTGYNDGAGDSTFVVVAATGLDFPTTNVLRVISAPSASGALSINKAQGYVDSMEVGDTIGRRFYFRVAAPTGFDSNGGNDTHATHDGVVLSTNEDHNTSIEQGYTTGRWTLAILHGPSSSREHIQLTSSRTLKNDSTYIIRDWVIRDAETTSVYKVQVFNSDGSLLHDVDDFAQNYGNGTPLTTDLSKTYGASNGVNGYQQFQLGINGNSPGSAGGTAYYYGAFAICSGLCSITYQSGEGGTP